MIPHKITFDVSVSFRIFDIGSQESPFWFKFTCGYLPQTIDVRNLVEVKKNGEALFIYFNDLKEISHKYWEYKRDVENKVLKDDDKSKKDNFKNTLNLLVKSGLLEVDEIVTRRKRNEPEKTCLTYEVLDEEFCTALLENYSAHMVIHIYVHIPAHLFFYILILVFVCIYHLRTCACFGVYA
jgi:hypothetical protein